MQLTGSPASIYSGMIIESGFTTVSEKKSASPNKKRCFQNGADVGDEKSTRRIQLPLVRFQAEQATNDEEKVASRFRSRRTSTACKGGKIGLH